MRLVTLALRTIFPGESVENIAKLDSSAKLSQAERFQNLRAVRSFFDPLHSKTFLAR